MSLNQAIRELEFARRYTLNLLDAIPESDWFRMPTEGVSHVAWQVGHLAMADYRMIERVRGRREEDEALVSTPFLLQFGRDSVPDRDPSVHPPASEIRATFDRVRARFREELPTFASLDLSAAPEKGHMLCATKLECLFWCAAHEMLHAGQIGLLRRLLGAKPLW